MKKQNYNNYTFARGKLGDFLMNVDLAKRLNEVDGSITKIITFRNYDYFKQIESGCAYIKILKINLSTVLHSLFDYAFNNYSLIYVAQLHLRGIPEKYLKYSIIFYCYLSKILSRGKFYAHTFADDFPFIKKENLLIYEYGNMKKMQFECNIDLVKIISGKTINHRPILDFKVSDSFRNFKLNDKKNIIFSLYAGERYKALDPKKWTKIFEMLKPYKNSFNYITIGAPGDKSYFDEIFKDLDYSNEIFRLEGKLDLQETCNIIYTSSGFIAGRTGTSTLATMLPINIPCIIFTSFVDRKWDYDYYKNLVSIRDDKSCKCTDGKIDDCLKQYEDTKRTMCLGELNEEKIFNKIKINILDK